MNRKSSFLFLFAGLAVSVGVLGAFAESLDEKPSVELITQGKELFTHKEKLGVKYACILCHQGEKAIKRSEVMKLGGRLPDVINKYLVEKAKGKALARDSQEMKALAAYIKYSHSV